MGKGRQPKVQQGVILNETGTDGSRGIQPVADGKEGGVSQN